MSDGEEKVAFDVVGFGALVGVSDFNVLVEVSDGAKDDIRGEAFGGSSDGKSDSTPIGNNVGTWDGDEEVIYDSNVTGMLDGDKEGILDGEYDVGGTGGIGCWTTRKEVGAGVVGDSRPYNLSNKVEVVTLFAENAVPFGAIIVYS
jgi:hypothetical protein